MRRRRQLWMLLAASGLLLSAVGAVLALVIKHEPAFYARGYQPSGAERAKRAQEFLTITSDFYNLMANGSPWVLSFNQEQLNAYLQDEQCASAGLFTYPDNVSQPRVEFGNDRLRIGFRYGVGWKSVLVSVDLRTWLVAKEPNVIALELCGLWVGGLPLGSHALMEYVTEMAREWNADVTWYRNGRHPVALIRLQANQSRPTLQLKRLEITDGHARVHGKPTAEPTPPPDTAPGG